MVEPQYTDKKRKEAEKRASGRTERALAANPDDAGHGHAIPGERAGPSARKKPCGRVNQAPVHAPLQTTDSLIVEEGHHGSYEVAAMETYINAHQRGICRRMVSNEFFRNRPRECCLSRYQSELTRIQQHCHHWCVPIRIAHIVLVAPHVSVVIPATQAHSFSQSLHLSLRNNPALPISSKSIVAGI